MEWNLNLKKGEIEAGITYAGSDILAFISGGEKPHLGCTVLSVPRPSLKKDGTMSATSSVLNVCGHKDETLCRYFAEALCIAAECTVVCTGGFHKDEMTEMQIEEVMSAMKELTAEIIRKLKYNRS